MQHVNRNDILEESLKNKYEYLFSQIRLSTQHKVEALLKEYTALAQKEQYMLLEKLRLEIEQEQRRVLSQKKNEVLREQQEEIKHLLERVMKQEREGYTKTREDLEEELRAYIDAQGKKSSTFTFTYDATEHIVHARKGTILFEHGKEEELREKEEKYLQKILTQIHT